MARTRNGGKGWSWIRVRLGGARQVRLEGMARVRVHTRVGKGKRVPMVGWIPKEALDEIRMRLFEVSRGGRQPCRLEARLKSLEPVEVGGEPATEIREGRKLVLGVRVREGAPDPRELRGEFVELILEAERIAEGAVRAEAAAKAI